MPKGNPQLEDGYTPIANELLESILRSNINKQELFVILAIIRQTYGWKRKEAEISFNLFQKLTGIDRRNVARSIKSLLAKNLISRQPGTKMKYGKTVYKYVINKKDWCKYDNSTGVNTTTETGVNTTLNKTRNKILNKRRRELVDKLSSPK